MSEKIKVKYRIERSEFIGFIEDCDRVDGVNDIIKIYKKKYHDARQICYGGIIDEQDIYNDDKEPSGTAGFVILNELKKNKIKNKIVIIVRYFGGIKLGKDGLKNAYCSTTNLILSKI